MSAMTLGPRLPMAYRDRSRESLSHSQENVCSLARKAVGEPENLVLVPVCGYIEGLTRCERCRLRLPPKALLGQIWSRKSTENKHGVCCCVEGCVKRNSALVLEK